MIPTYNCAGYLRETLESVLIQDMGPELMQIEVVDDCSTKDDPEAVVKELGHGRIYFFRQPKNNGVTQNFNTCIERACGKYVHILHGDDLVRPGFYSALQRGLDKEPTAGAAFCRHITIDPESRWKAIAKMETETTGILSDSLARIVTRNPIQCPGIVVRRSVYENIGGFHPELFHTSDWEMWRRIAAHYPIWHEQEPLACYRVHKASDTIRLVLTAENVRDSVYGLNISLEYMSSAKGRQLIKAGKKTVARSALHNASFLPSKHQFVAAGKQWCAAVKTMPSPDILWEAGSLLLYWGWRLGSYAVRRVICSTPPKI
jgi:glycosyltransferase involved in cell wall biosynthesis